MTISPDSPEFRFEVALSFAGPHRDKVRAIAERLNEAIDPGIEDRSQGRVFFDEWFRHEILGPDMEVLLQRIYHKQTLMPVADLSEDYANRRWTQAEARGIRALRMDLDTARDETARLRILNVRFDTGDVPGVLDTEGYLDGINLSAEEIANDILKRRELLRERLGHRENLAITSAETSEVVKTSEVCPSPKGWVWHSTLATRAAGQVSVLAVVETLLAITLYWWIAIRFETHWHLVSSVFIAPLLLLRSPESIAAGVRFFLKDWFGIFGFDNWQRGKQVLWIAMTGAVACGFISCLASQLSHHWLVGLQGWRLFCWAAAIGAISSGAAIVAARVVAVAVAFEFEGALHGLVTTAVAAAVAIAGAGATAGGSSGTLGGVGALAGAAAIALACAGAIVVVVRMTDAVADVVIGTFVDPAFGAAVALRALVVRVLATLFNLRAGGRCLVANWRETNLLTDSRLPAELMPGIRDHYPLFTLDGLLKDISTESQLLFRILKSLAGIFIFLPALLYRLNIKATAWFWWPLAYLLKPAPAASAEGAQRQALCWPWSNPAQRSWIVLSIGLALLSLVLHWLVATSRIESGLVTGLPLAVRVSSGWGWARLAPWHWALWIIAVAGAGMLLLAGNACSHHANGNWSQYRQRWPQNIRWMTALSRVRRLATVALLVMALGALLLQYRTWQAYVPVRASWVSALEDFYQLHDRTEREEGFLF